MNKFTEGQLTEQAQMVSNGCKPMSIMPIKSVDFMEAMNLIDSENVSFSAEVLAHGWITIFIYKDEALLEVIKDLPKEPKTAADHYLMGALCGYSNESICKFIKEKVK